MKIIKLTKLIRHFLYLIILLTILPLFFAQTCTNPVISQMDNTWGVEAWANHLYQPGEAQSSYNHWSLDEVLDWKTKYGLGYVLMNSYTVSDAKALKEAGLLVFIRGYPGSSLPADFYGKKADDWLKNIYDTNPYIDGFVIDWEMDTYTWTGDTQGKKMAASMKKISEDYNKLFGVQPHFRMAESTNCSAEICPEEWPRLSHFLLVWYYGGSPYGDAMKNMYWSWKNRTNKTDPNFPVFLEIASGESNNGARPQTPTTVKDAIIKLDNTTKSITLFLGDLMLWDSEHGSSNASAFTTNLQTLNTYWKSPNQACSYTSYGWNTNDYGNCTPNSGSCGSGIKTRTVNCKTNTGDIVSDSFCTQPKPESQNSCSIECATCNYTYGPWSECNSTNIQNRNETKTPTNCIGGTQEPTTQWCDYIPTCTKDFYDYNLSPSICPVTGTQIKTYYQIETCENGIPLPMKQTVNCTYNAPLCKYELSPWGECNEGIQTRTATITNEPCQETAQILTKTCPIPPLCTTASWTNKVTECIDGTQTKIWTRTDTNCSRGIIHPTTEKVTCQTAIINCTEEDWNYKEDTYCQNNTKVRIWNKTNETCSGGISHPEAENITCDSETDSNVNITNQNEDNSNSNNSITETIVPTCNETNWSYILEPEECTGKELQIKYWKIKNYCKDGVQKPAFEVIECNKEQTAFEKFLSDIFSFFGLN